jgi:hypothetical protein
VVNLPDGGCGICNSGTIETVLADNGFGVSDLLTDIRLLEAEDLDLAFCSIGLERRGVAAGRGNAMVEWKSDKGII